MKPITKITTVASVHFGATLESIIGATIYKANALRDGLEQVGMFGEFLNEVARFISQPASALILSHIDKESILMWPILIINSVLWAFVIVGVYRVATLKKNNEYT